MSTGRSDINRLSWDSSDFPILCEKCLGITPYLRMIKAEHDSECKICKRPFTLFSWKPDKNSRYKRTEICQVCARIQNVCQTCLFDLQFGLPVEIRDKFLKEKISIPKETANRDFFTANNAKNINKLDLPYNKPGAYPLLDEIIKKKQNKNDNKPTKTPKRNLPHICTFYLKGMCSRGEECPFRHEIPLLDDDITSKSDINARYMGIDDPISKKILNDYNDTKAPKPPQDKNITTLYISGITDNSIKEKDLMKIFSRFGDLKGVKLKLNTYCAFVTFVNREDAEKCISELHNKLIINMEKYRLTWAKLNNVDFINEKGNKNNEQDTTIIDYKTECPLYDKEVNKNNMISKEYYNGELITTVDLTCYDKGIKPYYATMDKSLKGGILKKKRKFEM